MKITATRSQKKLALTLTAVTVVLVGGYLAFAATSSVWPFAGGDQANESEQRETSPEVSDINDTEEANQKYPEANNQPQTPVDDTSSKKLTPGNTESTDTKPVKPKISHATMSGNTIEVVATFDTTANGTCQLTLTKPGQADITRESAISIGASYYICGFTVEGVSGDGWTAEVRHAYSGKISDAVTQKVE